MKTAWCGEVRGRTYADISNTVVFQVMHMDLKASNVFLTKTYSIAKIGEVDMAQVMGSTTLQRTHTATFAYSAPELILHGPCNEKVRKWCLHSCRGSLLCIAL